jgi:hypothetical protein
MSSRPLGLVFVVIACLLACESVPDLRFVTADAGDKEPTGEAGSDAGGKDAGTSDSSKPNPAVCSTPAPAGGTCCGAVWCLEECGADNCAECAQKGCAAGEVCCGKTGTVVCKPKCP